MAATCLLVEAGPRCREMVAQPPTRLEAMVTHRVRVPPQHLV